MQNKHIVRKQQQNNRVSAIKGLFVKHWTLQDVEFKWKVGFVLFLKL